MKFENIKAGDIVYIRKSVEYGFRGSKPFFVPVEVVHVTKTQFVAGDNRFKKENGTAIGTYRNAYLLGEQIPYEKGVVTDESKEFAEFQKKVNLINSITPKFDKLERNSEILINADIELIERLNQTLGEICKH